MRRGARPNALRSGKLRGSTDKREEEMPKLDGKIAVITGGNSGIGLATAKVFVKNGARVYITGRRQPELEAAAVLLGPNATPVQGDVSKPADLDRLYGQIRKEVGRVDVVFANAGLVTKAPEGAASDGAARLDHLERLDRRLKRLGQLERLQRLKGGGPQLS
jgi:NAD(P)-dependent dehydrogenase (short-subunit alcohol dehydrogenase family)